MFQQYDKNCDKKKFLEKPYGSNITYNNFRSKTFI